jgi:alpha-ketoglutarate-dependent taurine dioxygenase
MSTSHAEIVAERDPAKLAARRLPMKGYPHLSVGPVTHLREERGRLAALRWERFDARPLGSTIGAELHGIDLCKPLDDAAIDEIRRALHAYKVLFFRDQPLTAAQHVAFASRFGELEVHPFIPANTGEPTLVRLAKSAEVGGYENQWHHDVTWRERPSQAAVLHAIEVPATGGDTLFADMVAAYQGLDDEWKQRIEGMVAVHDYTRVFGHVVPEDRRAEMRAKYPLVEHPVVGRHPVTGQRYLYVNRVFTSQIRGISREESLPIIDALSRQAEVPEYQCRFRWQKDSVAFWDNRAAQHYAASDYWPDVRVMERASIVGERPVA